MTKIDIFSGFLGAGKTTLIKKLIAEAYAGEKLVLIENEFGEIGIDGGFLQDSGVEVTEMNSGCICCSLVGDFGEALKKVLADFVPDRILIEPSGVGKLSDVIKAVQAIGSDDAILNSYTTVVDAAKCKMYMKNFGEFFNDQVENAATIILSHTSSAGDAKCQKCIELIREHNADAVIVATSWDKVDGKDILAAMERENTLEAQMQKLKDEEACPVCGHHHHDEHHHEHSHGQCHAHHHDHDEHCHCGEHHEHHHEHGEHCHCGEHHDHHHHADDVFTSWGRETTAKFTKEQIQNALSAFADFETYGTVLRAKGIVEGIDGEWIHFDYVPDESDVRTGSASVIGRICVIGSEINESAIAELFNI